MKTLTTLTIAILLLAASAGAYPATGFVVDDLTERLYAYSPVTDWVTELILDEHRGASRIEVAEAIISFVQSLEYVSEEDDLTIPWEYRGVSDWWQLLDETLLKGTGDCEDFAMLCYGMLRRAGIDCAIVMMPGHMAVAVDVPADGSYFEFAGREYYYVECTDLWPIGEGLYQTYQYCLYTI